MPRKWPDGEVPEKIKKSDPEEWTRWGILMSCELRNASRSLVGTILQRENHVLFIHIEGDAYHIILNIFATIIAVTAITVFIPYYYYHYLSPYHGSESSPAEDCRMEACHEGPP